nr:MAG TPA: hypothetical protein [Crassvirales sp.]
MELGQYIYWRNKYGAQRHIVSCRVSYKVGE